MRALGWLLLIDIGGFVAVLAVFALGAVAGVVVDAINPERTTADRTAVEPIQRSTSDPCDYFLVEVSRDNDVLNVVTRQDLPDLRPVV